MNEFGLSCDCVASERPAGAAEADSSRRSKAVSAWRGPEMESARMPVAGRSGSARRLQILLLDDNASLARLIALLLAGVGYEVDTAEDGEEGWEALNRRQYDLLLTDNDMPRLKGLDLVRRARTAGMTLPIIVVSGSEEVRGVTQDGSLELTAVLGKPFRPEELLAEVGRAVQA